MPSFPWPFARAFPRQSATPLSDPGIWARNIVFVGKVFLVAHVFQRYIGGIGATDGVSMVPTIPHSYRATPYILYSTLNRRGRNIKVGDVIIYDNPLFPKDKGSKRVIGMPGDFVSVMTSARENEDLNVEDVDGKWARVKEELIRVPEGHCWVAGDNLEWSRDSRLYGPLPLGLVRAKVLAVVFPFEEAKWLRNEVDTTVPGKQSREQIHIKR